MNIFSITFNRIAKVLQNRKQQSRSIWRFLIFKVNLFWGRYFLAVVIFQIFLDISDSLDGQQFFYWPQHGPMGPNIDVVYTVTVVERKAWFQTKSNSKTVNFLKQLGNQESGWLQISLPFLFLHVPPHTPQSHCCWMPQLQLLMSSFLHKTFQMPINKN